ncbi:uroporphyrinogen-III C-methyltransferase [Vibrio sp. SCSIO 43136]|uniref:uroporphyrinogen-III C-methyltransferase n=1 Tax=Vibrio sp. SCSIO 43136 TaxID=2819101 RepID=UPI0020757624|nr:uroporphyrinogen-III C-methyltransferase [Vibrio sp. SCSIO 43136]USD65360.1 uroporphyrinogen-III C-methyltransferase [Vibrio sp. SCSIO 43136]
MTSKKNNNEQIDAELSPTEDTQAEVEAPAAPSPSQEKEQKNKGSKLGAIAIVLTILFGGGLSYHIQQKDHAQQQEIAALKQQLSSLQSELSSRVSNAQTELTASVNDATTRMQVEMGQQQKSIESLQVAISDVKGRRPNDWLLAEADYLVKLAGRKLFLEHDVESATRLMESADQRIAALNDPSLVPLRKSMATDITKLRALPLIDREGLVLAITSLQQQVDALPLANAILPEAQEVVEQEVSEDINDWQNNLKTSLKDFSDQFITFRTRDGNVVPLLSPEQHFYLRENVKNKLESAIKGVYLENGELFDQGLVTAQEWSKQFFNQSDNQVLEFQKRLEQLAKNKVHVDYPDKLHSQQPLTDVIQDRLRREVTVLVTEDK